MKKCYICEKDIDGGVVVDKECVDELIAENKRLKALEADGEWVRLPCKVGRDVWFIRYYDNNICKGKICSIINREIEPLFEINVCDEFGDRVGTIGQTENIFYTQAEAEAKLAKLTGAKENE